jgi:hypothetical protein
MRVVRIVLACVLAASLGGCAFFADPNAWPQKFKYGDSHNIASGPDIRFVNERERPMPGGGPLPTMCTEPSPDVAIAFGRSLSGQASIAVQGGTDSGQFNATQTETATELAGRTAGVLALRDGLYAACQAYTNGALGQNAYAMVLSQYGNLLVALASPSTTTNLSAAIATPEESAMAALLVSCVSEYDPTRLGALDPAGRPVTNPALSLGFCRQYLENIASGKILPMKFASLAQLQKGAAPGPGTPPGPPPGTPPGGGHR